MIPIYINNRNRLTTTRALVDYVQHIPQTMPILVDNDSDYPPLLEWYKACGVNVIQLRNVGPRAPWTLRHALMRDCLYYVVTDSDLDLTGVPLDMLDVLREGLERYPDRIKCGLSLEIEDLPERFASTRVIRRWEQKYWLKRVGARWWDAGVDTTFALYRSGRDWPGIFPSLRADRPYTARHVPWYRLDTEEERYYARHANPEWATWANWDKPIETQPARAHHLRTMNEEGA